MIKTLSMSPWCGERPSTVRATETYAATDCSIDYDADGEVIGVTIIRLREAMP